MSPKAGYHVKPITKGTFGELSKVREELEEAEDAVSQGCTIMELLELSDLYGALEAYVKAKHHKTMDDLRVMSDITQRVFRNGFR